jgi:two-component system OmpR family sensor kinase
VSSLPLRLRLTLAFAVVMAAVLAAMGLFVYVRVGGALLSSVDASLRAGAVETSGHLRRENEGHLPLVDPDAARGETLAQLLDAKGRVLRSTPANLPSLVDRATAARVRTDTPLLRTADLPGREHDWRLLATRLRTSSGTVVLVLATSLAARHETLHRLLVELLVGGAIALLLASLAGYGLAAGALRPVEAMRRRAAAITASTPGRRLPVPAARDEIARLAETLNDMLARLESALEHERRFVADASHELRTPLALLRTELEVALRRPRSREELEAALRSATEETERLTRLAEDLLLIARSDQDGLPIRREPVAASELLSVIADRFAARAREAGRPVVVRGDETLVLSADRTRLEQALGNLVDNALTHGRGPIALSSREQGGFVELHVEDEGDGFPAGFVARAFDRFSRADEARGRGGTGLGLSIVELIARAHGGRAGASSRPGGGADVWITVERVEGDLPAQPGVFTARS